MNPYKLEPYIKADELRQQREDNNNYLLGQYVCRAVIVAIDSAFNGRKASVKYFDKPLLEEIFRRKNMTQEERDEEDLRKMIQAEEQFMSASQAKGLPETKA